ncbi:hypothetical protein [Rhodococcus sp. X156]|uniref:hypothetical protein n=1 Tax=Rhodococcus sp. X156 TaxID=2499145 RepID=UPI000FD8A32D|nr:hypothetical protein [Rhodococcus sp. X156]
MSTAPELLAEARTALERYVDVAVDPSGALAFAHGEVPCAAQAIELAEGLVVLSVTCVIAWDLDRSAVLDAAVARAGANVQFGALGLLDDGDRADVTLRYAFPAAGLDTEALATLLLLVLSAASHARTEVLAAS